MSRQRQPSLRLLSLNVNGLRSADKRRTLFSLLHRDRWDVVLLQETHHTDDAEAQAWTQEGPHALRPNWSGPSSFWCHGSPTSRGVAILLRPAADIADITLRHQAEDGRAPSIDFSFAGGAFTAVSVYAPCVAAQRAAYFTHTLLPSLPTDRQLLVGGDFNCVAGQLDVLGPDSSVLGRTTGYYDGLRIAETDRQLFDIWRDRYPDRQTFTHAGSQSLARLDRWLVSEQLRRWISTAPDALDQTAGYPGDHQGVTLSLTAPGGTYFGRAAWRMPLHLLDDEGFCTEIADVITAYLQDHPTSELLSRGQRWVHLKRHLRLRATTAALRTARARRQALRALEMDSRTAQAQYEANPADAASLLAWRQAHHLLQQLNAAASHSAAVQAGVVWQHYGEQSTFWFYHLARERQAQTTITQLHTSTEPLQTVTLDSFESTQQAAQALETYYSASTPEGLFAPPQTSLDAQDALLAAVDRHLTPAQHQQGEGAAGDGSISVEDLTQALSSLPRGKAPGFDGLPYEFYQRFWEQLGPELTAVLQAAFQPDGPGQLPPDMTEGRITLLYKGKGLDRALPASYRPITLLNTDYKLAARVLADRLGPLLNHVVDSTQTGFLPQRRIGDNILAHLEIIAWYLFFFFF